MLMVETQWKHMERVFPWFGICKSSKYHIFHLTEPWNRPGMKYLSQGVFHWCQVTLLFTLYWKVRMLRLSEILRCMRLFIRSHYIRNSNLGIRFYFHRLILHHHLQPAPGSCKMKFLHKLLFISWNLYKIAMPMIDDGSINNNKKQFFWAWYLKLFEDI